MSYVVFNNYEILDIKDLTEHFAWSDPTKFDEEDRNKLLVNIKERTKKHSSNIVVSVSNIELLLNTIKKEMNTIETIARDEIQKVLPTSDDEIDLSYVEQLGMTSEEREKCCYLLNKLLSI